MTIADDPSQLRTVGIIPSASDLGLATEALVKLRTAADPAAWDNRAEQEVVGTYGFRVNAP